MKKILPFLGALLLPTFVLAATITVWQPGGDLSTSTTATNQQLSSTGVGAGAVTLANITIDAKGRITAKASGTSANIISTFSGTCNALAYLRGDGSCQLVSGLATPPGGSNTQVQYNSSSTFAGSANLVWDNTNAILSSGSLNVTGANAPAIGVYKLSVGTLALTSDSAAHLTTFTNSAISTNTSAIQIINSTAGDSPAFRLQRVSGVSSNWSLSAPTGQTYMDFTSSALRGRWLDGGGLSLTAPSTNTYSLSVAGSSALTTFTGTNLMGLQASGASSTTDYSGIDFLAGASSPTLSKARIAVIAGGGGSTLTLGTSNTYASGITNSALSIGPNGQLTVATPTSTVTSLVVNSVTGNQGIQTGDGTSTAALYATGASGAFVGSTSAHATNIISGGSTRIAISGTNGQVTINAPSGSSTALLANVANGLFQMQDVAATDLNFQVRPNSGRRGCVSYVEDSVANRWGICTKNGNSELYFGTGAVGSLTDRVIFGGTGGVTINAPSSGNALTATGNIYSDNTTTPLIGVSNAGTRRGFLIAATGTDVFCNGVVANDVCIGSSTGKIVFTDNDGSSASATIDGGVINATTNVTIGGVSVCQSTGTNCPASGSSTGSFSPTFTGFSSAPSATWNWAKDGNHVCILTDAATGTSNTTAFTVTNLPAAIQPARLVTGSAWLVDNGANIHGAFSNSGGSATMTFRSATFSASGFTASGTKSTNGVTMCYAVN